MSVSLSYESQLLVSKNRGETIAEIVAKQGVSLSWQFGYKREVIQIDNLAMLQC